MDASTTHPREEAADERHINDIVRRVQWERIQELDPRNMEGSALLPYAHNNVIALADELHSNGYHPLIVWGQLVTDERRVYYDDADLESFSVEDVEDHGDVHFWVEIPRENGERLVCDISAKSETGISRGDMLVSTGRPPEYRAPPESVFEYEPEMEPADLRSVDHYGSFKHKYEPVE